MLASSNFIWIGRIFLPFPAKIKLNFSLNAYPLSASAIFFHAQGMPSNHFSTISMNTSLALELKFVMKQTLFCYRLDNGSERKIQKYIWFRQNDLEKHLNSNNKNDIIFPT